MARPWLSVIMPTYNGSAYLAAALDSVLAQQDDEVEIIAVDDGSTDATVSILQSYAGKLPLHIVRHERIGNWVANTNHGLAIARAAHVCFLHQDDLWLNGRLRILKRLLARTPRAALLVHPTVFIGTDGRHLGLWRCPLPPADHGLKPGLVVERLLVQNFIAIPATVFPRKAALQVGGLDESLWFTADWDLWLKLAACGLTVYYPGPLAALRLHPESQTIVRTTWATELRAQLETVLNRHLKAWKGAPQHRPETSRAARFSLEVNLALAALAHGQKPDWRRLGLCFWPLGPAGWRRFLRDSRIVERVSARVGLGKATRKRMALTGVA